MSPNSQKGSKFMEQQEKVQRVRLWDEHGVAMREIRFRNVLTHLFVDRDFYESLGNYQPKPDLLETVKPDLPEHWRIIQNGIYYRVMPPEISLPYQGWKIHVSATVPNANEILRIVTGVCVSRNVAYKFTSDRRILQLVNSKQWDRGASGKFITVYPHSEDDFRALLEHLYSSLSGYDGPYVLSDRRYKDCKVLYYRYGGIAGDSRLDYTGAQVPVIFTPHGHEVPDLRRPVFAPPPWIEDPFPTTEDEDAEEGLCQGRYTVLKALNFSNTGGVYEARDNHTGKEVVIKEARPHTGTDDRGNDSVRLLEKEWRL
jgi:hypothetical protein